MRLRTVSLARVRGFLAVTATTVTAGLAAPAPAGGLPVPCIGTGSCGASGPTAWVTQGGATATTVGNQLNVTQTSANTLLNWQSFNIGAGNTVNFIQPGSSSLAVNQIYQGSPSQIFGALNANGRVYLLNQNGILFGAGAQVNTAGLVAASLNLTAAAIANGIATASLATTSASFVPYTVTQQDGTVITLPSGPVTVAPGASLTSSGGQIFLFAPTVTNQGTISTPNGQTILAAGNAVYLATSPDPSVRGLTVAVDAGGTVTNGSTANTGVVDPSQLIGQINAQHGNVTLLGLAVNQDGRISANTSVTANGSIYLIAADRAQAGKVTLGPNSVTEAPLDATDTSVAVDATAQQKSAIWLQGYTVDVLGGATVTATSGAITLAGSSRAVDASTADYLSQGPANGISDGSRVYVADGATLDVSGATAILPMSANSLQVQLRGSELADEPLQRNGALRGDTVNVDVRQYGTLDGTSWVGTPLANLSGDVATIQRGILERNETGGTVTIQSSGDVIVSGKANVNVSGGASDYQAGFLDTSTLLGANGQLYSITNASPNLAYAGIANSSSVSVTDSRWGVTTTYTGLYGSGSGQWQPAYVQGASAGTLDLVAPHVLFDAALTANVTVGPYQRLVTSMPSHYDDVPLPGTLVVGSPESNLTPYDFIAPAIEFAAAPVLPTLRNADGSAFDPLNDPWPAADVTTILSPSLIGPGAAGQITLAANGTIDLPAGVALHLPVGGSFSALASVISIEGSITGAGAAISLKTENAVGNPAGTAGLGISIASGAVLDAAGAWVNDSPALNASPPTAPLALNGGSITIAARDGDAMLAPGAVLDVSGGAQLTAAGAVNPGAAGSIAVTTTATDGNLSAVATTLGLGATLRGYGVTNGGSLTLGASALCVTSAAVCGQAGTTGLVTLGPAFFTTGGFAQYTLDANYGGFELTAGTQLRPLQENFLVSSTLAGLPSASGLTGLAPLAILPDTARQPVSLAIATQFVPPPIDQGIVSPSNFSSAPSLVLGAGSAIVLDPLASVALTSNTRILDDGLIAAPGGSVSMTVTNQLSEPQFIAGHQLWLGPDSVIDVRGTTVATTNDLGITTGSVYAGGSVALTAQRGAVETEPGSAIDVSGTSATLDLLTLASNGASSYQPTNIGSAGGSVTIFAAEAALLGGSMSAASGAPGSVPAGSFSLTLDGTQRYGSYNFGDSAPAYPYTPRAIDLAATQAPVVVSAGADLPTSYDGLALVSATALVAAGFDAVSLRAATLDGAEPFTPVVPGLLRLDGNVALTLGRSLAIDAAGIVSNGGEAMLAAPYVSLGQTVVNTQGAVGPIGAGTGTLEVDAGMIDLFGHSSLGGFAAVTLSSTGDIRADGVTPVLGPGAPLEPQLPGALTASGALTLRAQQVYPSTLTNFAITAGASGSGDLDIEQAAGTAAAPLSAGGSLELNAPSILQAGTLRAPLGSVVLTANSVELAAGSVTSTSTDGQVIPFGATQGGFDWVYPLGSGALVYGTDGIPVPTQSIQLLASSLNVAKGATLDVRGGGDLLATEFVTGPTGTVDVLANPTSFAILPTSSAAFGAYDPYYASSSTVSANETLRLSGGGGIAAGTYAVLPARYALLPGAYLVTPESGYQDLTPGTALAQSDGSFIVAGSLGYAGTTLGAARTSGFDILPGTGVQNLAQYTLTSASSFFTAQAASAGVTPGRLPGDSGYLALIATSQLTLDGTLEASPATGGRGADVDISSSALQVVGAGAIPAPTPGVLQISAAALTQLGAESILLGGLRSESSGTLSISTQASSVEVADGASLEAPEILLAATNSVTVDGGATVGASGTLPASDAAIALAGDGALLRVAASGTPLVTRSGVSAEQGSIALLPGSVVQAKGGAVEIDVSTTAELDGSLQLSGANLGVSGGQISLGAAPAGTPGVVLPTAALAGLSLASLSLASRGSLDFYDGASISATDVTITSGALRGFGGNAVSLSAGDSLTITGAASPSVLAGTGSGTGTLTLAGGNVNLGVGALDVSGFAATTIASQGVLDVTGSGSLAVSGSLDLQAALLTAESGATHQLTVPGVFSFEAPASPSKPTLPAVAPLGASLSVTAASIDFDAAASLHAGELTLIAAGPGGNVTLGSGASVDLSAVDTRFAGQSVTSPAGRLLLQSQTGSVVVAAGAMIDVAALDNSVANAGALTAQAPAGSLALAGTLLGQGADVTLDAGSLGDVSALVTSLVAGGFSGDWLLRQRGPGDLVVPSGPATAISGRSVTLTADQGNIDVEGVIQSAAAAGGSITLSAQNDVIVNGTLDARPQAAGQANGQILLQSEQGGVQIGAGATLEAYDPATPVQTSADGGLWIRLPRTALASVTGGPAAGLVLAGDLTRLTGITVEGYQSYVIPNGTIGAAQVATSASNPLFADATNFEATAPAIVAALGAIRGPTPMIVPGIELDAPGGSLTLATPWNLSAWRFGGVPAALTLRAAGDLDIDASLSDGFARTTGASAYVLSATTPSSSYRLAAGADLSSADPLAVEPGYLFANGTLAAATYGTGSLAVAAGQPAGAGSGMTMIRTGTGSIDVAAAGDVVLTNQDSVIYTAGIATSGVTYRRSGQLAGLLYPDEGGDINISAGGNVIGALSPDLVTNWLWRVGSNATTAGTSTAWTVNFADFEQGIGALGGGNVSVTAGGDIRDLSVSVPTIGRQTGGSTLATSVVVQQGGGDIALAAGGDVAGGSIYVGAGSATVVAGGAITSSAAFALANPTAPGLYPVVLLGEGNVALAARTGATLDTVANPTLLPQGIAQAAANGNNYSYFSTYAAGDAVSLATTTGQAELVNDTTKNGSLLTAYGPSLALDNRITFSADENGVSALRIYPGTLSVTALRGGITIDNTLTLFPDANGSASLLAYGGIVLGAANSTKGFELIESNADPALLPTVAAPQGIYDNVSLYLNSILNPVNPDNPPNAAIPVHLTGSTPDSIDSRIISITGSVAMDSGQSQLYFAAPAEIVAGQNVTNVTADFTNLRATDVSAVIAGEDVSYPIVRGGSGEINPSITYLNVDGPGYFELLAGGNINLGTSGGLTSRGNLVNPGLSGSGASLIAVAGVGAGVAGAGESYGTFITDYLAGSTLYTSDLLAYMQPFLGGSPTAAQALSAFEALPFEEQQPLVQTIFFDELLASGTSAAAAGATHGNFSRGYAAIAALFPGSGPDASSAISPYLGDISLYFSRVYTLDGGDISLLAPGGLVNAGLATAPAAFGVDKTAAELGIVAQSTGSVYAYSSGDFEVNQSRVFAADGGNILVWSTYGNIDAGRGAKTAISAPPPTIVYDNGVPTVVFPAALQGSGIQTLATTPGVSAGNVDLFAPNGVVNANDAGIVAGNLTIAATAVLGASNIKVSGVSVGVPVEAGGLGASLAGVSAVGNSGTQTAAESAQQNSSRTAPTTSAADAALGWLDVFVEGFGEDVCKASDLECLKRQTAH